MSDHRSGHVKRLSPDNYRGDAFVHWTMAMADRRTGWLNQATHSSIRELLVHTTCRYQLCCPVYCIMPDHLHMIWIGVSLASDQQSASKFFRRHSNRILRSHDVQWQSQAYDRVLRERELERAGFEDLATYIIENPVRAGITGVGHEANYPYTGCMIPGYPELQPTASDYWDMFWRLYSLLLRR